MQPDLSGVATLQPLLDKYADIPSVKALSDGLAAMAARPPQLAQTFQYTQTPQSSLSTADKARDQAQMMTMIMWWVPGALAGLGLLLLALGLFGCSAGAPAGGSPSHRAAHRAGGDGRRAGHSGRDRRDRAPRPRRSHGTGRGRARAGCNERVEPGRGTIMNTAEPVVIEGDTIVEAFRANLRRRPGPPCPPAPHRRKAGRR